MQYIVDDEVVVDISISTDSPKVDVDVMTGEQVTCDTELVVAGTSLSTDLIIEETKVDDIAVTTPYSIISNEETPTVSPLQIIDYGSSSIECAFDVTTEQAEEVVNGVLCGTTNPPTFENADYRLLHGQGSMDLAFAGLHNNTEYYLRPYALSNLGYKYGDVVAQRTKSNPIPDEYQLVEYIESTGTQWISTGLSDPSGYEITTKVNFVSFTTGYNVICGRQTSNYSREEWLSYYNGQVIIFSCVRTEYGRFAIDATVEDCVYSSIVGNRYFQYGTQRINISDTDPTGLSVPIYIFACNNSPVAGFYSNIRVKQWFAKNSNSDYVRKLYPVYRKVDNKQGMYDIINNAFYTNQGTGEFQVGPNKEWEE